MRFGLVSGGLVLVFCLSGCVGETVLTKPDFPDAKPANAATAAKPLIAITVVDDQGDKRDAAYADKLRDEICATFPNAIQPVAASDYPKPGQANILVHIKRLGAFFNRSNDAMLKPDASMMAATGAIDGWNEAITATANGHPVVSGSVYAILPGNWSGITDIEIEVRDLRPSGGANFTLPLIAERTKPNGLGSIAAYMVADSAWDEVSSRLVTFLNAAVAKVGAESAPSAK